MHDYDPRLMLNCWMCGRPGRYHGHGPDMICDVCDVLWSLLPPPVHTVPHEPDV